MVQSGILVSGQEKLGQLLVKISRMIPQPSAYRAREPDFAEFLVIDGALPEGHFEYLRSPGLFLWAYGEARRPGKKDMPKKRVL